LSLLRKRPFTLLEVMIVILLLSIAGSIIGIRLGNALEEKQFQTAVERLYSELESSRRMALNMQADWSVILEKQNDLFVFYRSCPESARSFTVQWKAPCHLRWNDEPIEKIAFLFSSTGKIEPGGLLEIIGSRQHLRWSFPEHFAVTEGTDGALNRPD
jgi:prepilin-type N-terminal cleavage/methylation domain-containing protein